MAPTTTLCCVSKTFLFSGRTAPSSCLRTNSVGQVASLSTELSLREPFKDSFVATILLSSFFLLSLLSSLAHFDNVKIVPYDTPIRSVLQSSAWSRLSKTLKMYLGIQFRRNLQYVFGNKSGTEIKRIFTEITKRTNKKQSVSFSACAISEHLYL